MLHELWDSFVWLIGGREDYDKLSVVQIIGRTVVIFAVALIIIRVGKRRFMGNYSAFDILMGFIVGSIMSRAITGAITLIDMVVVVSVLMLMHWLIATLTFHSDRFSSFIKNTPRKLIIDGEVQKDAMAKSKIGENDLLQALREKGSVESPEKVKVAYLERDGLITVVPKKSEPRILEVDVEDGVQTIRIELGE